MTLAVTNSFSAGASIVASEMNANFNDVEAYINTSPGVLIKTGGTVTGAVIFSNDFTVSGTSSLGTNNQVYIDATETVTGFATGTDITNNNVGSFLFDAGVPVGTNTNAPYNGNHYQYSKYDTQSGGGGAGADRPKSKYRLVINGSILVNGDIIGYTDEWTGNSATYTAGDGSRIECQWLNVRENVDINGYCRIQTDYDYARLYMGNDYSSAEDYIEWNDTLPNTSLPGFQFVHNGNPHLVISESSYSGSIALDLRAASGSQWPVLSGTAAVITTTGSSQLGLSSSSIRFKEDVEDLPTEDTWAKLRALKPRTFRWNEEIATSSGLDYETQTPEPGFIAEEVHEAAPDATLYDENGDPIVYRDKSMLALLVKAVQDIDQRLEALE